MRGRSLAVIAATTVPIAYVCLASVAVAGQSVTIPADSAKVKNWTAPRTPWGDPDLQGYYNNTTENGTPLERPEEFAGKRLQDITGEELVKLRQEIQRRTTERNHGPLNGPGWWEDTLNLDRGSQAWLVVDPPDGKIPSQTPEVARRAATREQARAGRGPADSYEDRSLYDRCISRGLPGSMMPAIYGNSFQIVQSKGYVAILYEMIHEARVIPLDATPHVGKVIRQYMGDARGHWEGDTLVVETVNFRDNIAYRGSDGGSLRIIERFTRITQNKVKWSVTFDDPNTWTRPWTITMPLTADDQPVPSYECHEGNSAIAHILSGSRADERVDSDKK